MLNEAADVADGLAQALLVLDQRDAHIAFAVFAKGPARGDGDFGVLHQIDRVVDGAPSGQMLVGDTGPDEHAGAGPLDLPANAFEGLADASR